MSKIPSSMNFFSKKAGHFSFLGINIYGVEGISS
jgi:hypothetical protein